MAGKKSSRRKSAAGGRKPSGRRAGKAARPKAARPKAARRKAAKPAGSPRPKPVVPLPAPSAEELQTLGDSITERAVEHFGGEAEPGLGAPQPAASRSGSDNGSS